MNHLYKFKNAMENMGIPTNVSIIPDRKIHRFHVEGDSRGSKNGWYVFYPDDAPSGAFGSWKSGIKSTWSAKSRDQMSAADWIRHRIKMEDACRQQNELNKINKERAQKRAQKIWDSTEPVKNHPYLINKCILPFVARQRWDSIILPITNCKFQLKSLQFIKPDGSKILLAGGEKKGNFILINNPSHADEILISEGFATGATLAEKYQESWVLAAIDADNLEPVAASIRREFPTSKIIICADDDRLTPGNPGITKGRRAAIAAEAFLTAPQWPPGAPTSLSDFNDLACWLNTANGRAA